METLTRTIATRLARMCELRALEPDRHDELALPSRLSTTAKSEETTGAGRRSPCSGAAVHSVCAVRPGLGCYPCCMVLTMTFDREEDGRWIASVTELRGVHVYGPTRDDAARAAYVLALRVLADEVEHGERDPRSLAPLTFALDAA